MTGMLERSRYKKIFWNKNSRIACLIFIKKKNIERNLNCIFFYYFHRFRRIKSLFWNNNFFFSKNGLKKFITKTELEFLYYYYQVIKKYIKEIKINLIFLGNGPFSNKFTEITIKEKCKLIKSKKKFVLFEKNSIYHLNCLEITKLLKSRFLLKIKFDF